MIVYPLLRPALQDSIDHVAFFSAEFSVFQIGIVNRFCDPGVALPPPAASPVKGAAASEAVDF